MTTEKPPQTLPTEAELDAKRTQVEKKLVSAYAAKLNARHRAPRINVENNHGKQSVLSISGADERVAALALLEAFGTTSLEFQSYMMRELADASCRGSKTKPYDPIEINGIVAAMHGINPKDEIEGMLANQMIATHFAAMRCMRSLKNSDTTTQQDSNGNLAIKLLRTYTTQMEALQRYRGKGQQKMTVEHVHVYSGGQAIVGNVTRPEGGGVQTKTEEQPHAKQPKNTPMPEMPSQNPQGQPVPIPRNV